MFIDMCVYIFYIHIYIHTHVTYIKTFPPLQGLSYVDTGQTHLHLKNSNTTTQGRLVFIGASVAFQPLRPFPTSAWEHTNLWFIADLPHKSAIPHRTMDLQMCFHYYHF